MSRNGDSKQKTPLLTHLVAGGAAGFMEACTCHPLDTIKVRMQLAKNAARGASVRYPYTYIHHKDTHLYSPGQTIGLYWCRCQNCQDRIILGFV